MDAQDVLEQRLGLKDISVPDVLSILPVRGTILFPGMILPIAVGKEPSVKLVDEALIGDKLIGIVAVHRDRENYPEIDDLYSVGTAAIVVKMIRTPDGGQNLLVQGVARIRIDEFVQQDPYYKASVTRIVEEYESDIELDALVANLRNLFQQMTQKLASLPPELSMVAANIESPVQFGDMVAATVNFSVAEKQEILEIEDLKERLKHLTKLLTQQIEILDLSNKIQTDVKSELDERQKEYFLREQLKAIQRELGDRDERTEEIEELRKGIAEAKMPPEAEKEANRELERLAKMHPSAAEYTVSRTYLDWLVELPWSIRTEDNLDIAAAEKTLDADHYDLEKVKKRIVEYLAVRKLRPDAKGPILCFAGPPGVGKTSLGMSIARTLSRKFIRMSLGGMRDEAEVRGHRRTYIGALPGRIIQGLRKAGSNNPVFMLDEVDKIGMDFRGDPSSALLEVLDPEQNFSFTDHYLSVGFDLSKVMFIVTANVLDTIPPALRDRMEVLDLPGYTLEEKIGIAKRFLIPKQVEEHGLTEANIRFEDEGIKLMGQSYTREAGVRNLEREIAAICRAVAKEVAEGKTEQVTVAPDAVTKYLGPIKFFFEVAERTSTPGVATGLAWTPTGGEILFVEATKMPGNNQLHLTGQLGEVMKESAHAALSYVRANASSFGLSEDFFEKQDIHVHVPAGAIPKDGPSAGVAMLTALVSLLTAKPVRSEIAMTGEITLRGLVLPVGGIKEKVLAAKRSGVHTIILPDKNEKDLAELPEATREGLAFHLVSRMDEVIEFALTDGAPQAE